MADINALYSGLLAADPPPRLGSAASQPSPTGGPNEGHRCWPRQDNGCLAAAGLTAPLPAASLHPDLPCTDDPELFFAESPDDVETAKALCRECPARAACLAGALKRREPWGVWGRRVLPARHDRAAQGTAEPAPQDGRGCLAASERSESEATSSHLVHPAPGLAKERPRDLQHASQQQQASGVRKPLHDQGQCHAVQRDRLPRV